MTAIVFDYPEIAAGVRRLRHGPDEVVQPAAGYASSAGYDAVWATSATDADLAACWLCRGAGWEFVQVAGRAKQLRGYWECHICYNPNGLPHP